jgi:hypothetical protein
MARRALEIACREHGAVRGSLVTKIQDLGTRGVLDPVHVAAATAVRLFGNYGAHPDDDLLNDVDDRSAEQALQLVVKLLEDFTARAAQQPAGRA